MASGISKGEPDGEEHKENEVRVVLSAWHYCYCWALGVRETGVKESCEQITNISETKTRNSYLGKHVSTDADV